MSSELTTTAPQPIHMRVRLGVRHPANWLQLARFVTVGASGYVVNLGVFALCVHGLAVDYHAAAVIAYAISVVNNFWLNRHWTFAARQARPARQGARFFTVSLVAFAVSYLVLVVLVDTVGVSKLPAQAAAIVASTPLNFIGQKLWSFAA